MACVQHRAASRESVAASVECAHGAIVRADASQPTIALIFTGGSYGEGANEILDTLKARGIHAGFFVTGDFLDDADRRASVRRMVREGHYVGPHSDSHPLYCAWEDRAHTLVTEAFFRADLERNIADLRKLGALPRRQTVYFIPPYEWYNAEIAAWSRALGVVLFNFTPGSGSNRDWIPEGEKGFIPSADIAAGILAFERSVPDGLNGFLLLMHLGSLRTDKMPPQLPALWTNSTPAVIDSSGSINCWPAPSARPHADTGHALAIQHRSAATSYPIARGHHGGLHRMTNQPAAASQRLMSLDTIRGITIAGMILVNNPGSWRHIYEPLEHAHWFGWTPTDLVFPFFLFIVGAAMAFALERRLEQGVARMALLSQALRRAVIIFALGLVMAGFPDWRLIGPYVLTIVGISLVYCATPALSFGTTTRQRVCKAAGWLLLAGAVVYFVADFGYFQATHLRIPGVLQRIALCYFAVTIVLLSTGWTGRIVTILVLLVGYQWIVAAVAPPAGYTAPVTDPSGLLHDWIDAQIVGTHVYVERPDPEGLLSTLPAIATTLCGLLAGGWLRGSRDAKEKTVGLFFAANVLLVAGLALDPWIPIGKKIWTASYVLLTAGLALHLLAMCYWLIDVRQRRAWAKPFVVFGTNAIVVYVASSLLAKTLVRWHVTTSAGETLAAKTWLYQTFFTSWATPLNASLLYALAYVTLWLLLLLPLYRARILIRV
ncbi:MAG TPA: polysaccharide deacetylase family protein [Phycisphaerae bacterium]|nr:polysaccharide deacetylase family protein [Phycisphaerae bacterium]